MSRLYVNQRQFVIHSRHLSHRQSADSVTNLIRRQQSATRLSRAKLTDNFLYNICSSAHMPRRDTLKVVSSAHPPFERGKVREAWKTSDETSTKEETEILKANPRKGRDMVVRSSPGTSKEAKMRVEEFWRKER